MLRGPNRSRWRLGRRQSLASTSFLVDPGWTGIVEVLVSGPDGAVRWERDSVVLKLPDETQPCRVGDLDGLRLCLGEVGLPVMFDVSRAGLPGASIGEFRKKLAESGLMVDVRQPAVSCRRPASDGRPLS